MSSNHDTLQTGHLHTRDNIPLACDYGGSGEQLLLFIHGWTCRRKYWESQLAYFAQTWQVAAPDLPGHGDSNTGHRKEWRIANLARDTEDCVRELNPKQTILIGHSMGGAVVLEAARLLGKKATAVILVDTFGIDYGGLWDKDIKQMAAPFETDFASAVSDLVEQNVAANTPIDIKKRVIREMSQADPTWALPLWRDLLSWDPLPALRELKIPIHAINGILIPESARKRCAPFVAETIIPGGGHFLQLEDPAGFNQTLEQVLLDIT